MEKKWQWIVILFLLVFPLFLSSAEMVRKNIIILETMPVDAVLVHTKWFTEELKRLSVKENLDVEIRLFNADGDRIRAVAWLDKALKEKTPDLVVTNATLASQVAYERLKNSSVPILFFTVSDPVGAGLIKAEGVPSGENITGRIYSVPRDIKLNMVKQLLKRPVTFGFIHSSYPSSIGDFKYLSTLNIPDVQFIEYEVPYRKVPEGINAMLGDVRKGCRLLESRVDFWWEPLGPLGELGEYTDLLLAVSNKPIAFGTKMDSVKKGALLHITADMEKSGKEVAALALAILLGADPGTIPPVPPASFILGVNLKTALESGIVVPPDILELAGDYVFK